MSAGSRHRICYVAEVGGWGVTPATPVFDEIRQSGCTLGLNPDTLEGNEIRSDRQRSGFRLGARKISGDVNFDLAYDPCFDDLLEAALMGTWATDTPSAGTDRLINASTRRPMTMERYFGDQQSGDKPYHRYTGCEIDKMSLKMPANGISTGVFSFIGEDVGYDTAIIAGATYPAVGTNPTFDTFSGILYEGGVLNGLISEVTLTLENNLETRMAWGSKTGLEPIAGECKISGSCLYHFANATILEKLADETESSLQFTLVDKLGNELQFHLPKIVYTSGQPDVKGPGNIVIPMSFEALYDSVSGYTLGIERTPV